MKEGEKEENYNFDVIAAAAAFSTQRPKGGLQPSDGLGEGETPICPSAAPLLSASKATLPALLSQTPFLKGVT